MKIKIRNKEFLFLISRNKKSKKEIKIPYFLFRGIFKNLKNISFSIKADEIVSIIGPSGSGKTSIIMLTAGLEKISKGSVIYRA